MSFASKAKALMADKAITRMVFDVAAATVGTVTITLLVVAAAVPLIGLDAGWQTYALAAFLPAILTPLFSIAFVRANYKLHKLKRELRHQASSDPLTGLLNRRAFFEQANAIFDANEIGRVSILMIDLDHFKIVNDTFGHAGGDNVIRDVAVAIAGTVIVNAGERTTLVGRIGGEEFVVLIANMESAVLAQLAERIGDTVRNLDCTIGEYRLSPSCSIGVANRVDNEDVDATLRAADAALYQAKDSGRDRWCVASAKRDYSDAVLVPELSSVTVRMRPRNVSAG
jgi:diguanylate cyclase (GGDEF)-like protein